MKITLTPETDAEREAVKRTEFENVHSFVLLGPKLFWRHNYGLGQSAEVQAALEASVFVDTFMARMDAATASAQTDAIRASLANGRGLKIARE